MNSGIRFLTAEWRRLALVTFRVPDEVLQPLLPPGTVPDRWEGSALASVVAFEFEKTALFGIPALGFRSFPEWNLRFYLRQGEGEPACRGVAFVREFVPSAVVAGIARSLYNEPYLAVPYEFERHPVGEGTGVGHAIQFGGKTHRFRFLAGGEPFLPSETSLDHFLKEQAWGFGITRSGLRVSYRVEHAPWRVYPETRFDLEADFSLLYGPRWAFLDRATPLSKIVAEGSPIKVFARTVESD